MVADNRKENILILAVFLTCLLALVAVNLLPGRAMQSARVKPALQLTGPADRDAAALPAGPAAAGKPDSRWVPEGWGRDPFKPLTRSEAESEPDDLDMLFADDEFDSEGPAPLKINLILISEAGRTVTINGRIYKTGDEVQGERIVEIKENGIVLANNEVRRFLFLRDSGVRLEVHGEKQKVK